MRMILIILFTFNKLLNIGYLDYSKFFHSKINKNIYLLMVWNKGQVYHCQIQLSGIKQL